MTIASNHSELQFPWHGNHWIWKPTLIWYTVLGFFYSDMLLVKEILLDFQLGRIKHPLSLEHWRGEWTWVVYFFHIGFVSGYGTFSPDLDFDKATLLDMETHSDLDMDYGTIHWIWKLHLTYVIGLGHFLFSFLSSFSFQLSPLSLHWFLWCLWFVQNPYHF